MLLCGASNPVMNYINATVHSNIGNTSENRGSLTEEEIMKLNVKETMNSNIKKQLVCGCISLVGNIMGYSLVRTECYICWILKPESELRCVRK